MPTKIVKTVTPHSNKKRRASRMPKNQKVAASQPDSDDEETKFEWSIPSSPSKKKAKIQPSDNKENKDPEEEEEDDEADPPEKRKRRILLLYLLLLLLLVLMLKREWKRHLLLLLPKSLLLKCLLHTGHSLLL